MLESGVNDGHVPVAPRKVGATYGEKRERMRAVSRLASLWLAGALALSPATALAQQQASPPASTPPDSVGPKALQNFTLGGPVTRQSDQPAAAQPAAPTARPPGAEAETVPAKRAQRPSARTAAKATAPTQVRTAAAEPLPTPESVPPPPQRSRQRAVSSAKPSGELQTSIPAAMPAASTPFAGTPSAPVLPGAGHSYSMLLWMLEALALVVAIAFHFWRTRGREMFAGSANFDLFTAPDTAPTAPPAAPPTSAPAPRAAPEPRAAASSAVVSTGLRPQMEMLFQPLRCILEDERVVLEFELELYNAGSAPARHVLVEARLFNAGAEQDAQIVNFFANPIGTGDRIAVIPPLKRLAVRTEAVAPRDQVQAYELAGRPVFVPVIAFNALYSWSGGEGQTSVSYLFGRDGKGDKLAPFRLDLGPHIFRGLACRLLPTGIRR